MSNTTKASELFEQFANSQPCQEFLASVNETGAAIGFLMLANDEFHVRFNSRSPRLWVGMGLMLVESGLNCFENEEELAEALVCVDEQALAWGRHFRGAEAKEAE